MERLERDSGDRISDIYDGKVYKHYVQHHGLSDWWNVSLALFCDGAPIFESSKQSMWPYMFCILELDSDIRYFDLLKLYLTLFSRYLPENMIFGGFWLDQDEPFFPIYINNAINELLRLASEGMQVFFRDDDNDGQARTTRAHLLYISADNPAKAQMLGLVFYNNSLGGCIFCDQCPLWNTAAHSMVYRYDVEASAYQNDNELLRNRAKFRYLSPFLLLRRVGFQISRQIPM
jgi:hypothetical protein